MARQKQTEIKKCANNCGKLIRPYWMTKDEAPGTFSSEGRGMCSACYKLIYRNGDGEVTEPPRPTTEQNTASLEAYFESRRPYRLRLGQTVFPEWHGPQKGKRAYPKRKKPTRQLVPCGTLSAYQRHLVKKEPIDDACREANRLKNRKYRERKKAQDAA